MSKKNSTSNNGGKKNAILGDVTTEINILSRKSWISRLSIGKSKIPRKLSDSIYMRQAIGNPVGSPVVEKTSAISSSSSPRFPLKSTRRSQSLHDVSSLVSPSRKVIGRSAKRLFEIWTRSKSEDWLEVKQESSEVSKMDPNPCTRIPRTLHHPERIQESYNGGLKIVDSLKETRLVRQSLRKSLSTPVSKNSKHLSPLTKLPSGSKSFSGSYLDAENGINTSERWSESSDQRNKPQTNPEYSMPTSSISSPKQCRNLTSKSSNAVSSRWRNREIPKIFSPTPTLETASNTASKESPSEYFEQFDLLEEAKRIFRSLLLDISKSFEKTASSPLMTSVIKKCSGKHKHHATESAESSPSQRNSESTSPVVNVPSASFNKKGISKTVSSPAYNAQFSNSRDSTASICLPRSTFEEKLEVLAEMEGRALEYRNLIKDHTDVFFAECEKFSVSSLFKIKDLVNQYDCLRENFDNFKTLRVAAQIRLDEFEPISNLVTDVIQTSLLEVLIQENETFMVRLQFGIYMFRAYAKLLERDMTNSFKIRDLEMKADYLRKISLGYNV